LVTTVLLDNESVALSRLTILKICKKISNMKTAILATLIAAASAFAPAKDATKSTALNMAFESELGAQPPLGFFDPLGIVASGDVNNFERLRYVEIKHGRICMLGVVGYLVTEAGLRFPGDLTLDGTKFSDIPSGFAALSAIPEGGLIQLVGFIGFLELFVMKDIAGTGNEHIGDFRNGAIDFGWDSFDEATKLQKRAIELNQGRAAQMGLLALMVHEKLGVSLIPSL
jgi:Chlorophyll A-B binding protein